MSISLRYDYVEPSLRGFAQLTQPKFNYYHGYGTPYYKLLYHRQNAIGSTKQNFNGYKKPTKYLKHTSGSKLKSSFNVDAGKKCCGNEWLYLLDNILDSYYYEQHYDVRHMQLPPITNGQLYLKEYQDEDIKPVVEHIEDDLKYDFRTNTHSF